MSRPSQALLERILGDQGFELQDDFAVPATAEVGLDTFRDRR